MQSEGVQRDYYIHVPSNYNENSATPVVFAFAGWGNTANSNERYMGFTRVSDEETFIMVYPEGMSDYCTNPNKGNCNLKNSGWESWNAVGSTTTLGEECTKSTTGYCYTSCDRRPQGCGRCDWTTCYNDGDFVEAILDTIEQSYCVNTKMVYATGYSNGGMMAYEVGLRLGHRVAAIVPGGGQPFVGHNDAPAVSRNGAVSVLDLHGSRDSVCPANGTTSVDGWNYEPVDNVMRVWAAGHGCTGSTSMKFFKTAEDGTNKLYCVQFGECADGIDFVRCSYDLGHQFLGYNTDGGAGARLAWAFMKAHPKVTAAELAVNKVVQE